MWGRKRRAMFQEDQSPALIHSLEGQRHFLRRLKSVLDEELGEAPLHVCIEAANPRMLGRSSELLMQLMLSTNFGSSPPDAVNGIQIHFIADRLSVPPLDGHVLAIGGPRSNVISRIAMEYEMNYSDRLPFYRRYTGACFRMRYSHIHRRDYDDRVLTDIESLDSTALEIIYHYYNDIQQMGEPDSPVYLFSANRCILSAPHRELPSLSLDLRNLGQRGVLTSARPVSDYVLYDQTVETLLPNVFSTNMKSHALLIMHGLRNLGTFTGAALLDDPDHLAALRARLVQFRARREAERAVAAQRCWSVIRPLEHVISELDPARSKVLTERLGYDAERTLHGQTIALKAHRQVDDIANKDDEGVDWARVEHFNQEIKRQHYSARRDRRRRSVVKFDQIDENQILDAMSLPRDPQMRRHQIYVLGCFEAKKTVFTQQTRAMTLIHALFKAGKIGKGRKICIIGGGVSGMAAAVAAAETGTRVVLLEQEDTLAPVINRESLRYLHPRFYDWPQAGCEDRETDFPLSALNWKAGSAGKVLTQLNEQFEDFQREREGLGDFTDFTVYRRFPARMVLYDPQNRKHVVAKWQYALNEDGILEPCQSAPSISEQVRAHRTVDSKFTEKDWWDQWRKQTSAYIAHLQTMGASGEDYPPTPESSDSGRELDDYPWSIVDCDVVVFATGFGQEIPEANKLGLPETMLLNKGYWTPDTKAFEVASPKRATDSPVSPDTPKAAEFERDKLFVVSGSGDGALIDILRLCIEKFDHEGLVTQLNALLSPNLNGAVWANQSDVLVFGDELARLFASDDFRLVEGEKERLAQIDQVMSGFDIDAFLDRLNVNLNRVQVYNVSCDPQPFWPASCTAHRLLVWCLYKKGRVRFIQGVITGYIEGEEGVASQLHIRRRLAGKTRRIEPKGVVIRHGVGSQNAQFLRIQGLLPEDSDSRTPEQIADDGRRLVALLRLSSTLHPETEKFFRHTIKHLR